MALSEMQSSQRDIHIKLNLGWVEGGSTSSLFFWSFEGKEERGTAFNVRKTDARLQVISRRRLYKNVPNVALLCARNLVSFCFILHKNDCPSE